MVFYADEEGDQFVMGCPVIICFDRKRMNTEQTCSRDLELVEAI